MNEKGDQLSGQELANYLENHREEFNGNGDALCMAAGYGIEKGDGTEKCNFTDFIKALSNAVDLKSDITSED